MDGKQHSRMFNNRLEFLLLWGGGVLGSAAVLPYLFSLQRETLDALPVSLSVAALLSVVQSAVLLAALIFLGLRAARAVGFRVFPSVAAWHAGGPAIRPIAFLVPAAVGLLAGITIYLLDLLFYAGGWLSSAAMPSIPLWQGALASLYGGITEEIIMRLFLLSACVWILARIFRIAQPLQNSPLMWGAIIFVALLFGIGHLPAMAAIAPLTPVILARVLLLNGIGGIIFGYFYWRHSLEAAMAAHFMADIGLHVIMPAVVG